MLGLYLQQRNMFLRTLQVRNREQAAALVPAVSCQLCGGPARLPHRNCANLDCNRLFVACNDCAVRQCSRCYKVHLDMHYKLRAGWSALH